MEMKKISKQSKKITLISLKTKNLKKRQVISICKLKNTFWKWTIQKQLRWHKKTAKKNDINNMLLLNNRLVGYPLLRKRNAYENNKIFSYYYFDAFVIHKEFRNKGLGKQLILFNNKISQCNSNKYSRYIYWGTVCAFCVICVAFCKYEYNI